MVVAVVVDDTGRMPAVEAADCLERVDLDHIQCLKRAEISRTGPALFKTLGPAPARPFLKSSGRPGQAMFRGKFLLKYCYRQRQFFDFEGSQNQCVLTRGKQKLG